ncbi:MAG: type II toxin-antitoxin system VapC family toxin [Nitrospirae bacterium]|nr:type II toxin-antitoxin system VapC family toxin [Nitrospirota bacterium]MBI3351357.1 type II toxin-antitoxin system VapC family toxin [Nitrospirota bacterium]
MSGRYLLDTNIIIALFSEDPKIHKHITNPLEIFIPAIAIGELYFGAYKSGRMKENHARIDEFARSSTVLSCDTETAKRYGDIKNRLKEKGRPIPENDLWIAAIAQQYDLTLVSRDTHFDNVEELQVEVW